MTFFEEEISEAIRKELDRRMNLRLENFIDKQRIIDFVSMMKRTYEEETGMLYCLKKMEEEFKL